MKKIERFFRFMEWIGVIICICSAFIYSITSSFISEVFIFVGGLITLLFILLRKIIKQKGDINL